MEQFDRYWTWELCYSPPEPGEWGPDSISVGYGVTRNRQRAINQAAKVRLKYTKKHIPKAKEEVEL